ncbi:Heme oxygenase 1, chloroplastic [Linum perenne]
MFDKMPLRASPSDVGAATTAEKQKKRYPGEAKGFVEEMRFVAMKLHTREQAKEGEKEVKKPEEQAIPKWEPTVDGYLRFLVDSKLVYDTLEQIVHSALHPICKFISCPFRIMFSARMLVSFFGESFCLVWCFHFSDG